MLGMIIYLARADKPVRRGSIINSHLPSMCRYASQPDVAENLAHTLVGKIVEAFPVFRDRRALFCCCLSY